MKLGANLGRILVVLLIALLALPGAALAISASPSSVDFGDVALNTTATQSITVTVDAGYAVSDVSWSSPVGAASFFAGIGTCETLTGGFVGPGTCTVTASATPTGIGSFSDVFEVQEINGSATETTSIPASGTGISLFAVNPSSVDFGNVPLNTTASQNIAMTVDTGYFVSFSALSAPFALAYGTCVTSSGLFQGPGTCSAVVSYTPDSVLAANSATLEASECPFGGGTCVSVPIALMATPTAAFSHSPASVNFGDVLLNTTATQAVAVTVDAGYSLSPITSDSALFGIDPGSCLGFAGPGTCDFYARFTPTSPGPASGSAAFEECSASGGCLQSSVSLQGTGVNSLSITTASLPGGTYGSAYAATLQASGGTGPYMWSVAGGSLPPGLALNPSTGQISGTPTAAGTFSLTAKVTDSGTPTPQTATKAYSIDIAGSADLAISVAGPSAPVSYPKQVTFKVAVKNLGPTGATGVTMTDAVPSGSQFASLGTSQGSCTTPPAGSTGTIVCSLGTMASGSTATVTLTVNPTVKKSSISDTATVAPDASTIDPVSSNNTATATVQMK